MTHATPTLPLGQAQGESQSQQHPSGSEGGQFLALLVPSDEGERQAQAMENFLQACSSDEPFALELVGTRREQGFLLRTSSQAQLTYLTKQIEAQYPQAQIQRVAPSADPLLLHPDEHAVVGSFALAQPSYLPLKTFTGKALAEAGADPLAGLLAAMEAVSSGERIIAQLALVRAPESWLAPDLRKSVEHALQGERDKQAVALRQGAASVGGTGSDMAEGSKLAALLVLALGGLLAYHWYRLHATFLLVLLGVVLASGLVAWCWWQLSRKPAPLYDTKLVAEKMARAGFYCQLRVIAIGWQATSSKAQLATYVTAMEVAYRQFTLASSNRLLLKRRTHLRAGEAKAQQLTRVARAFPYASPLLRFVHDGAYSQQVFNALELSGMFHLPQETTDLPLVRRVSGKELLASPEIAHQLAHLPVSRAPLPPALMGTSQHRRMHVPVYLPFEALFSHKFLAGMSRSGKSVLIQLLTEAAMRPVRPDARATTLQPGVFVADPHRDLVMDLLQLVPPSRAADVLLLDLTDTAFPVALNPLDASMGFTRDQAVSNLMSSFQKIWAEQWGPRMAYFLNSVCLLLYTLNERLVELGRPEEQYTLLDINPLLQYKDYATELLSQLDMRETWHQELLVFWQTTYFTLNPAFKNEVIMPIISKIGVFNDNQHLRRIVGQPITKTPVHQAISEGKIVLCALSARDMDDNAVNILGSTLINLLHRSFGLQQAVPLSARRRVFVAIDEFQNFSGSDFDKLLSEDAKYGCSLLLATQSLKRLQQIREGLLEMVLSNCQQLCVFRVSAADAKLLEAELQEKVTVKHIISQPGLHCYARLAIAGYPLQIVSVELARPASWQQECARAQTVEAIRRKSQQQRSTAQDVDRHHEEHLRRFLSVGNVQSYANKLQREVRAAHTQRKARDEADDLMRELQAAQILAGTKPPSGSRRSMPGQPPEASEITGEAKERQAQHQEHQQGPGQAGQGRQGDAPDGMGRSKVSRNHRRSRHMGKRPVGVPPPVPKSAPMTQGQEMDEDTFPLPGTGGTFAGGMGGWGSSMGYEGREGREQG